MSQTNFHITSTTQNVSVLITQGYTFPASRQSSQLKSRFSLHLSGQQSGRETGLQYAPTLETERLISSCQSTVLPSKLPLAASSIVFRFVSTISLGLMVGHGKFALWMDTLGSESHPGALEGLKLNYFGFLWEGTFPVSRRRAVKTKLQDPSRFQVPFPPLPRCHPMLMGPLNIRDAARLQGETHGGAKACYAKVVCIYHYIYRSKSKYGHHVVQLLKQQAWLSFPSTFEPIANRSKQEQEKGDLKSLL